MAVLDETQQVAQQYKRILSIIAETAIRAGRKPEDVKLVVVTKGHDVNRIRQVVEAGATRLGENYAEEAVEKQRELVGVPQLEWHMIGHIQSRKAELVVNHFDFIHSVDSLKLAQRLERFASELDKKIPLLLEFNVSGEETKFGFSASEKENWDNLLADIAAIAKLPHLHVCGLMTMAPYFEDVEKTRPVFRRLVELQNFFQKKMPDLDWHELSMGMSADFEVAIQEGATIVRIGQAILGPRQYKEG
ncbi:MAG: YggS family pyridoxal phosphate-dependent enzyme [Anaerolineales bacterium]